MVGVGVEVGVQVVVQVEVVVVVGVEVQVVVVVGVEVQVVVGVEVQVGVEVVVGVGVEVEVVVEVEVNYYGFFKIPRLPKTINAIGRMHWGIKAKEAKLWRTLVVIAVGKNKPARPLKKAQLTFTRFSSVEPDPDNRAGSFKHVQDGLKDAGVIVDDKPAVIGMPEYKWGKAPPKQGYITIEVRGLE